jgi:cell division septum initiation protein DivIVA
MDILYLVDRLEEATKAGRRLPFGNYSTVDEGEILPLLDQMRISIPEEIRRAERIIREKERTLAQAHEEADRIVALARKEAARLSAEHTIAQSAESRAVVIRERAEREADQIRGGADAYAFDVLCRLEQELKRTITVVENGIRRIQADQEQRQASAGVTEGGTESPAGP